MQPSVQRTTGRSSFSAGIPLLQRVHDRQKLARHRREAIVGVVDISGRSPRDEPTRLEPSQHLREHLVLDFGPLPLDLAVAKLAACQSSKERWCPLSAQELENRLPSLADWTNVPADADAV